MRLLVPIVYFVIMGFGVAVQFSLHSKLDVAIDKFNFFNLHYEKKILRL